MMKPFPILFLLIFSTFLPLSRQQQQLQNEHQESSMSSDLEALENRPPGSNVSFIFAQERTLRKDPLNNFQYYTAGYNLLDKHYIASVGFTAVPFVIVAIIWFSVMGIFLLIRLICCCCCCCCRTDRYGYSPAAYACSLMFLVIFTAAAFIGCVVLYTGQTQFHDSLRSTTKFIVNQAEKILNKLIDIWNLLSSARNLALNNEFLPPEAKSQIDKLDSLINSTAEVPQIQSEAITHIIFQHLEPWRLSLIVLAAIMLTLTFLGFFLSLCGLQCCVYVLVVLGWVLVTVTFLLCGVFLVFHNIVGDTCMAMDEWVDNPQAESAMREFLPCFDAEAGQEILNTTRVVTVKVNNLVNDYITNVANKDNIPPNAGPVYHNQSGPLVPLLCDLNAPHKGCVPSAHAIKEWSKHVCQVSDDNKDICTTKGRITRRMLSDMEAAVNVSNGLQSAEPLLMEVIDCSIVKKTFREISDDYCPGLSLYSQCIYVGLVLVSGSVMFSLIFWIVYLHERSHRAYTEKVDRRYAAQQYVQGAGYYYR